jgi:hypothetical protein
MNMANEKKLTEREEQLLMQYADGAGSWWVDFRARRLLDTTAAAREFVESLRLIGESVSAALDSTTEGVDVWNVVERRIDQEQRTELYLGKRSFKARESIFDALPSGGGLMLGAPVAACILIVAFLFNPGTESSTPGVGTIASNNPLHSDAAVTPVAVHSQTAGATTKKFARDQQDPWEVEWIRSDGRVRMIQHRSGRAPTLWIRREAGIPPLRRNEVHTLKDGSELRIIDKRIPEALAVTNE